AVRLKGRYQGCTASTKLLHGNRITRTAGFFTSGLELTPDVLEVIESGAADEPLGGANRTFRKTAAGLGVVAEVDPVGRAFEDKFMHADCFTFPERSDLEFLAAGVPDDFLDCEGSAGRRVLLVDVVTLEDLALITVFQGGGGDSGHLEEQVHAKRKVGAKEQSGSRLFDFAA